MFKKLRALWKASVAVVIVCLIIAFLSVAIPIIIALIAALIVGIIGYATYQVYKDEVD